MSDVSYNRLPFSDDDRYLDSHSPFESTDFESSTDTVVMENTPSPNVFVTIADDVGEVDTTAAVEDIGGGTTQADAANKEEPAPFTKRKRKKTSEAWHHFCTIKYWGTCNLLISIGAAMDPRYKMKLIDFSFKGIYSDNEAAVQIQIV
ncbi:hypothetical protein L1887_36076 [Cichorium endivia]|nr:hypothetical protein L1887_36076 [Cichorium endivia]